MQHSAAGDLHLPAAVAAAAGPAALAALAASQQQQQQSGSAVPGLSPSKGEGKSAGVRGSLASASQVPPSQQQSPELNQRRLSAEQVLGLRGPDSTDGSPRKVRSSLFTAG